MCNRMQFIYKNSEILSMEKSLKVLFFPWLAHGHISPFLELAKALSQRNFTVYFCSTSVNLTSIQKSLSILSYGGSIELVELNLNAPPDFLPEYHTTKNLPSHLMPTLKESLDNSGPEFSSILEKIKPDILIYDFLQPWAPTVASKFNIPSVPFLTSSAAMSSLKLFYYYNPGKEYPFSNIYLHGCEEPELTTLVSCTNMEDYNGKDRFVEAIENSSGMILIKGSREMEGKYIDFLSSVIKEKVVLVGSLVQETTNDVEEGLDIIDWLEEKEIGSTVFVSFGSEYFLTKEEIKEVAYGLDLSEVNFVWVVRSPLGEKSRVYEALDEDFFDKIKGKGLIIEGWAPQAKILTHKSIGGFVSHCGWSSVLEGINFNVPIVAVPMHIDQPINARIIEELSVGKEAMRNNGEIDRVNISDTIKEVINNIGQGAKEREKAISEKIRGKDGDFLDDFAEELKKLRKKNNALANGLLMD